MMIKKRVILFMLLFCFLLLTACQTSPETVDPIDAKDASSVLQVTPDWMKIDLADIRTGQTFQINDFKDKPILLESFAVWCPTCTKQQDKIKELHELIGDQVISISINTDPNEDYKLVQKHIEINGFDWWYTIAPQELTQALIDEFGINVISAPSAPVVLICPDQTTRFLGRGVKDVERLKTEIALGCA